MILITNIWKDKVIKKIWHAFLHVWMMSIYVCKLNICFWKTFTPNCLVLIIPANIFLYNFRKHPARNCQNNFVKMKILFSTVIFLYYILLKRLNRFVSHVLANRIKLFRYIANQLLLRIAWFWSTGGMIKIVVSPRHLIVRTIVSSTAGVSQNVYTASKSVDNRRK